MVTLPEKKNDVVFLLNYPLTCDHFVKLCIESSLYQIFISQLLTRFLITNWEFSLGKFCYLALTNTIADMEGLMYFVFHLLHSQPAHDVRTALLRRHLNDLTSLQCPYNVVLTSYACWVVCNTYPFSFV